MNIVPTSLMIAFEGKKSITGMQITDDKSAGDGDRTRNVQLWENERRLELNHVDVHGVDEGLETVD
jgi:hypothetical protein